MCSSIDQGIGDGVGAHVLVSPSFRIPVLPLRLELFRHVVRHFFYTDVKNKFKYLVGRGPGTVRVVADDGGSRFPFGGQLCDRQVGGYYLGRSEYFSVLVRGWLNTRVGR